MLENEEILFKTLILNFALKTMQYKYLIFMHTWICIFRHNTHKHFTHIYTRII